MLQIFNIPYYFNFSVELLEMYKILLNQSKFIIFHLYVLNFLFVQKFEIVVPCYKYLTKTGRE